MTCQDVLLISSSETALKSNPVRNLLERRIAKHIRIIFSRHGETPSIARKYGRIAITDIADYSRGAALASRVFGVATVMRAIQTSTEMNAIVTQAVALGLEKIKPNRTFAVKARRLGSHPFTSKDLENQIGSKILEGSAEKGVRVDLGKPDTTIYVEVKEDSAYVYSERIDGPGGLPYGCQGSVLSLFSGSLNSRLSTWLMMKRGARIIPLYCDGDDPDNQASKEHVLYWLKQIYSILPVRKVSLIVVPFKEVLRSIRESDRSDLMPYLKMRAMLKVANRLANEMKALGVVTGETLVGSSTDMDRLVKSSSGLTTPVYRPVVGLERSEIEELAKNASLSDLSSLPEVPETKGSVSQTSHGFDEIESSLGMDSILDAALAKRVLIPIIPE